jgi:hypothetical protein
VFLEVCRHNHHGDQQIMEGEHGTCVLLVTSQTEMEVRTPPVLLQSLSIFSTAWRELTLEYVTNKFLEGTM